MADTSALSLVTTMTEFAPFGGGYDTGHCWYYRLGGKILSVSEIIEAARGKEAHAHFVQSFSKLDRMEEPQRSEEIRKRIEIIEKSMKSDAEIYQGCVDEINRLRTVFGPEPYDWFKETYNEPTTAIMLKHNHISYAAGQIRALRSLQKQGDLFG